MLLLVRLRVLPEGRKTPITSKYRPDWVCPSKPEYNCASILLPVEELAPGATAYGVLLLPLRGDLWSAVKVGDILEAREGRKTTAAGVVTHTIRDDSEHEASLMRIQALWNAEEGTPESAEFQALAVLIEEYEKRRWPITEDD